MSIQKRRLDNGWSQEELAQLSGVSTRTIQRIENGNRAGLETLKCLAAVFETSVNELVKEQTMTQTTSTLPNLSEQAEQEAIAYVQNLKAFHLNWITFLIVMPVLFLLNKFTSPEFWWVLIVGGAWLLAIALHALVIFGLFSVFDGSWEQKEFQKRMRMKN